LAASKLAVIGRAIETGLETEVTDIGGFFGAGSCSSCVPEELAADALAKPG
jgi:hypothetical protein